jgi:outer membrane murein-binding lipoprotein Lpp
MLNQETINKLAALAKVKPEDLANAIKDTEEKSVEIGDLVSLDDNELQKVKSKSYEDGKEAGVEIKVKDLKEKGGYDFQGKTIEGLVEAAKRKALTEAKIEPDKKVQELSSDNQALKKQIEELNAKVEQTATEANRAKTDRALFKEVPEALLPADDLIQYARMKGYDFRLDENGNVIPYKNGEPIKDKLTNIRPAKDVLAEFVTENGLAKQPATPPVQGRGGGNSQAPSGTATTLSQLKKQFEEQGKSTLGEEYMVAVQKAKSELGEAFDMKS